VGNAARGDIHFKPVAWLNQVQPGVLAETCSIENASGRRQISVIGFFTGLPTCLIHF
jgi:hypothetical protein